MKLGHRARRNKRGFSLIEMLISLTIIGIITVIILTRYASFDSTVLLKNLAFDVALSIREAQTLSISVEGSSGDFDAPYGVRFTEGTTYVLFRDADGSDKWNSGEEVSTYTISNNNSITDLCVLVGSSELCNRDWIEIMFKRPEPDALMRASDVSSDITNATITVGSSGGNEQKVVVLSTGQISVE